MSWGRDIREKNIALRPSALTGELEPQMLPDARVDIREQIYDRAASFTPDWNDTGRSDAGSALVSTYATVSETVHDRLNRLPERLVLDHLRVAGVAPLPARPANALLVIDADDDAPAPVAVAPGFAFLVAGGADVATLETSHVCHAVPGSIAAVAAFTDGWDINEASEELGGFAPFGRYPTVRAELWIGIESPVAPAVLLSLLFMLTPPRTRPWASDSAVARVTAPPLLRWEALTSGGLVPLVVERDDAAGLSRTGVVQLRADTPAPWTPGTLPGRGEDDPLRWLRVRPLTAQFPGSVRLNSVRLNGVAAVAARSVRGEVAEPMRRPESGRSCYRLSQTPVVPGSVVLDVTDATGTSRWTEVADLGRQGPDDRAFVLDPIEGTLTFGDGTAGRAVPRGYRNVVALTYRTGGGRSGLPKLGDLVAARRSVPGLGAATVVGITAGADQESRSELARRGPDEIRSRRRAVAAGDYVTRALATDGVDIARAHCLPARDPRSPGGPVPGVVGMLVVPTRTAEGQRPVPDEATLAAVAKHLARTEGTVGAEVIATGPRYRIVTARATLVAAPGADPAAVVSRARDRLDDWLDPIHGAGGVGWPFGGPVRWDGAVRLLLSGDSDLVAVSHLAFESGSRLLAPCADVVLDADELIWPGPHSFSIAVQGATP